MLSFNFVCSIMLLIADLSPWISEPLDKQALAAYSQRYEDCQILDQKSTGDSSLLLARTKDGDVVLLMFQDVDFLGLHLLSQEWQIPEEPKIVHTAFQSAFNCYPLSVRSREEILLDGTLDLSIQVGTFVCVYILPPTMTVTCVGSLILMFCVLRKPKKADKKD